MGEALGHQELNLRENDGIEVKLMWRGEASTYVTVDDSKLNAYHEIEVPEPELASDVFNHPFSYLGDLALKAA